MIPTTAQYSGLVTISLLLGFFIEVNIMQQGTPVVSPELSTFLANAISTVAFYGDMLLVGGIVFAAIRILIAGDDVDLKTHMKALLIKLVAAAFLLSAAYPIGTWLLQLAGKH